MGVGIIELVDGKKQYNEYAGGGNSDAKSEYIYIEKFVNTEVLLDNYPLTNKGYINISGKKYAADTEVYLGRTNGENMVLKYSPLSFCMIPLKNILGTLYPDTKNTVNSGFFAYLGIGVELSSGEFKFTNHKSITENPFLTWYKIYSSSTDLTVNGLKETYPAMLLRGLVTELKTDNLMYIKGGTKKSEDADNYI